MKPDPALGMGASPKAPSKAATSDSNEDTQLLGDSDIESGGVMDDLDDFDEFDGYGKFAAGARIKGMPKSIDVHKMRANREAGAGRKFNKPLHKDKREP